MTPAEAASRAAAKLDGVIPFAHPIVATTCVDLESAAPHDWAKSSGRRGVRCRGCGLLRRGYNEGGVIAAVYESGPPVSPTS